MKTAIPYHAGGHSTLPRLTVALALAGLIGGVAHAGLQTAGELFVSVDATKTTEGPLSDIANTGTLQGFFEATGGTGFIPVIAKSGGTEAMQFDGNAYLQLVSSQGGGIITAPDGIVGDDPTVSVEVWALNPVVAGEECMVSWGNRGGPDGSNVSFGYGSDFRWGAVGHWGEPDIGWSNSGGNPTANQWHHLVYTYDGTTSRVYADGKLANAEILGAGRLSTHTGTAINICTQLEADGTTPTTGLRMSGAIARVRIHDGVLTDDQIANNYNFEKADFVNPVSPPPIAPTRLGKEPVHRYSFSEPATTNATGMTFKDSIGTADGVVQGDGAAFSGTRFVLTTGGSSLTQAYGDLPNGLMSTNGVANGGTGEFTFETWFKHTGAHTWSRVFDFGDTTVDGVGGEVTGPGGGGSGLDYLCLSAQNGDDVTTRRMEVRNEDPGGGGTVTADSSTHTFGTDVHLVVTWNEVTGNVDLYENGGHVTGLNTPTKLSDINDVDVWLGRSNWTGDMNTQGEYDEVRLYDKALTPGEILGNTAAGPDNFNDKDFAVKIVTPPVDATVPETLDAVFTVKAYGSSPIAFQWFRNGNAITNATGTTLIVPAVTAADNGATFTVQVNNTVNGNPASATSNPVKLTVISDTVTLAHRYSFNETSGSTVADSVGGADGTIQGGGTLASGTLTLDGFSGFVDLPNGIITALGDNGTIDMWVTFPGGGVPVNWCRVFDFGLSNGGEGVNDGGIDYLFFTPQTGDGFPIFDARFPNNGDTTVIAHPGNMVPGVEEHITITYSSTGNTARMYTNGVMVVSGPAPFKLSAMNNTDVNVWLGRSQFNDPYFPGTYNEFRLYSGAMTPSQVAASQAAGPDALPAQSVKLSIAASGTSVVVSWPGAATGFTLEGSPVLGPAANWVSIGSGTLTGGQFQVTIPVDQNTRFLRLKQ